MQRQECVTKEYPAVKAKKESGLWVIYEEMDRDERDSEDTGR